jgi:hypothetical protein
MLQILLNYVNHNNQCKMRFQLINIFIQLFMFGLSLQNVFGQEQENILSAGIRVQKTHNLYFENGLSIDYTSHHLWDGRIHLGMNYITSRIGTAYHSNAIKQDNYLGTIQYNFRRNKMIVPVVRMNIGFFHADLESPLFSDLPHNSLLLSMEGGIILNLKTPIQPSLSIGYNFITGDGLSGPGTLFPLFYQLSITYKIHLP